MFLRTSLMAFTIFKDDDESVVPTPAPTPAAVVADVEKENVHPITGARTGPDVDATAGKKRKNSVAALQVLPTKKRNEPDREQPELGAKRRKPLSLDSATAPPRPIKLVFKTKRTSSRAPSPAPFQLAKVDEEDVSQTETPLSSAYSQCSSLPWLKEEDNALVSEDDKLRFARQVSLEPALGDVFKFAPTRASSVCSSQETKVATPQPKHPFTCTAPSPARKRRTTRLGSVPRL